MLGRNSKMQLDQECYLCGTKVDLTRDHVPPKNLFPAPLPNNLITVPCCKSCNQSNSKYEEQFRVFVSSAANASPHGVRIWREKVVGSTFKRSPRLKSQFGKGLVCVEIDSPIGRIKQPSVTLGPVPVEACLVKITKGLLAHFYPRIIRSELGFQITPLNQFANQQKLVNSLPIPVIYEERGSGAFKFWRGVAEDDNSFGLWIYVFYDAVWFLVNHDRKVQLFPSGI